VSFVTFVWRRLDALGEHQWHRQYRIAIAAASAADCRTRGRIDAEPDYAGNDQENEKRQRYELRDLERRLGLRRGHCFQSGNFLE
jgi:hypothetical protein